MLWTDSSYKKNKCNNSLLNEQELIENYSLLLYLWNKSTFSLCEIILLFECTCFQPVFLPLFCYDFFIQFAIKNLWL